MISVSACAGLLLVTASWISLRLSGVVRPNGRKGRTFGSHPSTAPFLGSAFAVFWFFAFFEPPGRKNAPGGSKRAPQPLNRGPRTLVEIWRKMEKNQKTIFLRPTSNRFHSLSFVKTSAMGGVPASGTAVLTDF